MEVNENDRIYIAIDLKSFYASVECVERGLNPLTTNLVVADESRTEKTICLAVTPSLKVYGIPGRARLFEVVQKVKEVNLNRRSRIISGKFKDKSFDAEELNNPLYELDYIVAKPRMALYMEYSRKIYDIYLKYVAPEDIHIYSVDEVFMDITGYLKIYGMTASEIAKTIIEDVLNNTGITATVGIATNLYLCKVAMDIVAKHIEADENGVRIAELDEMSYRKMLWNHRPLTDFWRVGRGYAKKLEENGLYTMGDVARCSLGKAEDFYNEDLLYKLFGINAELLIDHSWGYEPCTINDIKSYKPETKSLGQGQVLTCPYTADKAKVVVMEMCDQLALSLVEKRLVTDQIVLTVGYDIENLTNNKIKKNFSGDITTDRYGRSVPKHAHGTKNLKEKTSSANIMMKAVSELFEEIVDKNLLVRRINITANKIIDETNTEETDNFYQQLDLFTDYEEVEREKKKEKESLEKERRIQEAMIKVKNKYGKNSMLKGINFEEGATGRDRNNQIGGHKA